MRTTLRIKHNLTARHFTAAFSLMEIAIVLVIITIMFGAMLSVKNPFQERLQLKDSALALQADLRLAQDYARIEKDTYKYYGLRFYPDLGGDILQSGEKLRQGWKIVRYEPNSPTIPITDFDSPAPTVIKSCVLTDNPEIFDKTFFVSNKIDLSSTSEFQINPTGAQLHSIVFTGDGSATRNGADPLTDQNDTIVLSGYGSTINITITPRTGHIEVGNIN